MTAAGVSEQVASLPLPDIRVRTSWSEAKKGSERFFIPYGLSWPVLAGSIHNSWQERPGFASPHLAILLDKEDPP
jgi:hypothetical protein